MLPSLLRPILVPTRTLQALSCGFGRLPASLQAQLHGSSAPAAQPADLAAELTALADRAEGLTPPQIVALLDKAVVGQHSAKKAVAIALRNRWRRMKIPQPMRDEVMPKNILMIGPTGSGKTEIARRLAKLADAPFLKVEATKYTELGYVGKDVDDMVKDLVEASLTLVKSRMRKQLQRTTAERAENAILEALLGPHAPSASLDQFRQMYREGMLDERTVEIDLAQPQAGTSGSPGMGPGGGVFTIPPMPGLKPGVPGLVIIDRMSRGQVGPGGAAAPRRPGGGPADDGGGGSKRQMKVSEARQRIEEAEADRLLQSEALIKEAVRSAEHDGIIFIDEIDKIVEGSSRMSGNVSSEGVQRDLLPIIEGSVVQTKYGNVSTDHVLFICSGAFHSSKPSDMLAELQGRLPIRVELKGLTASDFYRILTEPEFNMIRQHQALLDTEGIQLQFTEGALTAMARVAEEANRMLDNIGARRLHTVLERVLSDVSFTAPERAAEARARGEERCEYVVDEGYVMQCMSEVLKKQDLSRYVL